MVRQAVPQQPKDVNGGADISLQPVEDPMLEQVESPKGGCDPVGSMCWRRLLAGAVTLWREEPMLEKSVLEGLHPAEGTHTGEVHEEVQHMGRTHVREVHGRLSPVGGTPCWSRETV
ncbi:ubx domain-containing protein 4 [Limosa lapponica baueri]|uniref:Ubx domain-containing protein 4 n=1 Tax=Limosa lapponica baueri TaxID=1758121 RepID=A0A2I0UIG6_LIMLA|nr:ubx domain-containing protein 4 [Limosa lapponica baueri]